MSVTKSTPLTKAIFFALHSWITGFAYPVFNAQGYRTQLGSFTRKKIALPFHFCNSMSVAGILISFLFLVGGIVSCGLLISVGQIIRLLHDQHSDLWKRLGEPSGWGCRWKGCNRIDSLLNGHMLITDCLLNQPEWANDERIRGIALRIRRLFWMFFAFFLVSIFLAALLQ